MTSVHRNIDVETGEEKKQRITWFMMGCKARKEGKSISENPFKSKMEGVISKSAEHWKKGWMAGA